MQALPISEPLSYALTALQALLSLGLCVYLAIRYYRERRRWKDAATWPRVEATINSVSVGSTSSGGAHVWYVKISYCFTVDGNSYGWYTNRIVSSEAGGLEYASGLKGKTFPVRYQPGNPDASVVLDHEFFAAMSFPSPSAAG